MKNPAEKILVVLFICAMIAIVIHTISLYLSEPTPKTEIDRTFEFCQAVVQSDFNGYGSSQLLSGCLEVFSGKKIEIK